MRKVYRHYFTEPTTGYQRHHDHDDAETAQALLDAFGGYVVTTWVDDSGADR